MQKIFERRLVGERALFKGHDLHIIDSVFADGESPLKESENLLIENSSFQWKYPLWYVKNADLRNCMFFETARAAIWYTDNVSLTGILYAAPKGFRRTKHIRMNGVNFSNASETLWNCEDIEMQDISVKGDYFAMNSENIRTEGLHLVGNYAFDGCKNIEIHNSKLISKDAFWNCENVEIYDSYISGEYLGWNSKNVTLMNCTIESLQGFCYMNNVVLKNCNLLNTTLAFEYSTVDAEVTSYIDSVKNPISGKIMAKGIGELIFDDPKIDKSKTKISTVE